MIVIATYDDIKILKRLLDSLKITNNLDEEVLVIGTDISKKNMVEFLEHISKNKPYEFPIKVDFTPYKGYDSGAYIFAYKNYLADYYLFMQDSLSIKSPKWLDFFKSHRDENSLNAWATFPMRFMSYHQYSLIVKKIIKPIKRPPYGIFGPIFQISKNGLNKIDKKHDLSRFIPKNKSMQEGMERGWAYLAYNSGLQITSLEEKENSLEEMQNDKVCFHKHFYRRK